MSRHCDYLVYILWGAEYDLFWNDGVEEHYLGRLKAPINRTRSGMSTEETLIFLDEELEAVRSSLEGRVFKIGELGELTNPLLKHIFLQSKKDELTRTMHGIESKLW